MPDVRRIIAPRRRCSGPRVPRTPAFRQRQSLPNRPCHNALARRQRNRAAIFPASFLRSRSGPRAHYMQRTGPLCIRSARATGKRNAGFIDTACARSRLFGSRPRTRRPRTKGWLENLQRPAYKGRPRVFRESLQSNRSSAKLKRNSLAARAPLCAAQRG